jgi:hypothetical protein
MAPVYYSLRDNIGPYIKAGRSKRKKIFVDLRSDSKSTIEQLKGFQRSEITNYPGLLNL